MISRRSFLVGLGSLVTRAFVARAEVYSTKHGAPLLLASPPLNGAEHLTLYLEAFSDEPTETNGKWRASLNGPWSQDPPDTPTWRTYLELTGEPLSSEADVYEACRKAQISPKELDHVLPEESWCSVWESSLSPQARAYEYLHQAGLSCPLNRRGQKAGRMTFVEAGWHPGSSERWVELEDDVSVSLLQAHILERQMPVRVVVI